jgi:DNA-binding transcriptional LysR family regulator
MPPRFDLTDLELFVNVADAGSITHGAARTHLALASASARVRGMEQTLGGPLLERGRRGVRLTPAGSALAEHARTVLAQIERMRGDLSEHARGGLRARVRLLANTAALTEFLPEALCDFLAAHTNVDLEINEQLSREIVPAIAAGRAEIGIVSDTVDLGDLHTLRFRTDRLVVVTAARHPLVARDRVAYAEILDQPLVGLSDGSALEEHLAEHAARLGGRPAHRVRLRSFDAICRMVEAGIGVGVVPEAAARRCRRSMDIHELALTDPWAVRQLTICVRGLDRLSTHARLLVDHLTRDAPAG